MNKKRWTALGLCIAILIVSFVIDATGRTEKMFFAEEEWEEVMLESGSESVVAVLEVSGVITARDTSGVFDEQEYHHDSFLKRLESVYENEDVKAIVLYVNSPGGGVSESDEIFQRIMSLKNENEKPLVVFMDQVAASGGYYIAAPADHIMATRNTITGSIGVIMQSINLHQLAENWGVEDATIKSGELKDLMNPLRNMEEEEREVMQSIIDEMHQFFVEAIVEGRGMDLEKVEKLADGRIFSGSQALQNGLVDSLGRFEDAVEKAKMISGNEDATVLILRQRSAFSWQHFLNGNQRLTMLEHLFLNHSSPRYPMPISTEHYPTPMYLWTY
ncbi:signal peptide peptidase SppA [Tindallia californiensis]|uniref:Signal peptide peptidase A. Serine peptidase. MEROPS family S49 n=1 Tax=Tindallia californiensis TaxID=159292 RepID=A0A1H3M6R8_9FIRM|nr:signal peptide peptidase SppA [Tindallia californiensis]SDY72411.1 signal peptide peptidase A. Serine peptidase. MEROPS family S49 [Tindallia californiensis]